MVPSVRSRTTLTWPSGAPLARAAAVNPLVITKGLRSARSASMNRQNRGAGAAQRNIPFSLGVLLVALLQCLPVACRRADPKPDPAVGRRIADEFLARLRAGQTDTAWQS